jgi:DNA-binding NtrC family response regulator
MDENQSTHRVEILVVDDEEDIREFCRESLVDAGFGVRTAGSAREALGILEEAPAEIVLSDLKMPETDGLELLRQVKECCSGVDVVIMTGHATVETAVQALQTGAADYVTKPLNLSDLQSRLERLVSWRELVLENQVLRQQLGSQRGTRAIVGSSARMRETWRMALRYAPKRQPVLIIGESGTGKELIARAIHDHGPSPQEPFLPIDCSALSASLIESELFGHARGAFTGAIQERQGLLATAGKGTAFLDEIGELPLELQSKLLRALQEREFRPVGSNRPQRLEARIVAATNRNLSELVRHGKFRSDLFYRLNVLPVKLPPLRERRSDIAELARHFLAIHGSQEDGIAGIAPQTIERLMNYDWPGNVRELENCVQRALAVSTGPLLAPGDLPLEIRCSGASCDRRKYTHLEQLERTAIVEALEGTGGHRLRAAELLGIGKTTMYRKLKEYGLDDDRGCGEAAVEYAAAEAL